MKYSHVHKYMRVKLGNGGFEVFKCMIPGCPHYIRRELVIGRESICWNCGKAMVLNMANTTLKKPHHYECTKSKAA